MKRIFALLLCLGLALFLGCAGAEQATGLTPAQEARAIALAAGLTGLSQEQAAALSLTVEASAVGESIRFRSPRNLPMSSFPSSPSGWTGAAYSDFLSLFTFPMSRFSTPPNRRSANGWANTWKPRYPACFRPPERITATFVRPRPFATAIREKISPSACGNASSFSSPLPPIPWPEPSFS